MTRFGVTVIFSRSPCCLLKHYVHTSKTYSNEGDACLQCANLHDVAAAMWWAHSGHHRPALSLSRCIDLAQYSGVERRYIDFQMCEFVSSPRQRCAAAIRRFQNIIIAIRCNRRCAISCMYRRGRASLRRSQLTPHEPLRAPLDASVLNLVLCIGKAPIMS